MCKTLREFFVPLIIQCWNIIYIVPADRNPASIYNQCLNDFWKQQCSPDKAMRSVSPCEICYQLWLRIALVLAGASLASVCTSCVAGTYSSLTGADHACCDVFALEGVGSGSEMMNAATSRPTTSPTFWQYLLLHLWKVLFSTYSSFLLTARYYIGSLPLSKDLIWLLFFGALVADPYCRTQTGEGSPTLWTWP